MAESILSLALYDSCGLVARILFWGDCGEDAGPKKVDLLDPNQK